MSSASKYAFGHFTPMDTYAFARELARFLKKEPYNIPIKTVNKGLGKCELIFGGK